MAADERGLELAVLREDLHESIFSRHRLLAAKRRIVKRNRLCDSASVIWRIT
jgi:hypothetical protein